MRSLTLLALLGLSLTSVAQEPAGDAYKNLKFLCKNIGPRLSGSENAQKAVEWGKKVMEQYHFDNVYLQPVMVPHWERGKVEKAIASVNGKNQNLKVKALGGSVGTNGTVIKAKVIEVHSFTELESLGKAAVQGNIVFFNRPMDPKFKDTFQAYSGAVDQRGGGANKASKLGAVAVLVRSMSTKIDGNAHTGGVNYVDSITKIPAVAVSTEDAGWLSEQIKKSSVEVSIDLSAQWFSDAPSFNVIGELKGTSKPDEIITIGGHLDSWDVGEGAHDDGSGIIHSLEAVRLLKITGFKPKHTIRCVFFMNEENGNRGGQKYAEIAGQKGEKHIVALESDRGGFKPEAFSVDADSANIARMQKFLPALKSFGVTDIYEGYGGVDINPLKKVNPKIVLVGFAPESTHYFDYHHADTDVLEAVNPSELQLGAEACAKMLMLLDAEY